MKKYFIAVAALAFLAACNGKAAKDTPVLVEEESIAVAEAAPDAPSLPELPVVKAKPAKPVNMRDSLKLDPKKGAVVQKKYKGTIIRKTTRTNFQNEAVRYFYSLPKRSGSFWYKLQWH